MTFDEVCGGFPNTKSSQTKANYEKTNQDNVTHLYTNIKSGVHFGDSGSASRYFYCAKASKKDRDEGLEEFEKKIGGGMLGTQNQTLLTGSGNVRNNLRKNIHPTVKPTALMQYLVRLVSPNGATILDPFMRKWKHRKSSDV